MRIAIPFCLIALFCFVGPVSAHENHDHGDDSQPAGANAAGGGTANGSLALMFPDIIPFVVPNDPSNPWLVNWDIQGSNLRVQTIYANVGDGIFQIRTDGGDNGDGTTSVTQRVYDTVGPTGNFEDFPVNSAVNGHQGHGHIHFEDFSRFDLFESVIVDGNIEVGDPVAGGVKTSFALRDSIQLPGPEWAGYQSFQQGTGGIYQNISVGYGDRYSHGTSGQSFSIAGVTAGPLYWLRQTVDPDNVIIETDETNNAFEILIDLEQQGFAFLHSDGTFFQPGDSAADLPGPPPVEGDLDGDGDVDLTDWGLFNARFYDPLTNTPADLLLGDFNLDGIHDISDIRLFRGYFERDQSAAALNGVGVPEPASLLLLFAAAAIVAGRKLVR